MSSSLSTPTSILFKLFLLLSFLLSFTSALPISTDLNQSLTKRDVYNPPVLLPNGKSIWKAGSTQEVTWDVTHPPKQITNGQAHVILVTGGKLDFENPLAIVDVLLGHATVKVPDVPKPGHDFQILVMGDSGNTGEMFTITK